MTLYFIITLLLSAAISNISFTGEINTQPTTIVDDSDKNNDDPHRIYNTYAGHNIIREGTMVNFLVNGRLQVAANYAPFASATSPSIFFHNSPNDTTGIYAPNGVENQVNITTNGVDKVQIGNSNITLTTTTPANGSINIDAGTGNLTATSTGAGADAIKLSTNAGGITLTGTSKTATITGITLAGTGKTTGLGVIISGTAGNAANTVGTAISGTASEVSGSGVTITGTGTGTFDVTTGANAGVSILGTNTAIAGALAVTGTTSGYITAVKYNLAPSAISDSLTVKNGDIVAESEEDADADVIYGIGKSVVLIAPNVLKNTTIIFKLPASPVTGQTITIAISNANSTIIYIKTSNNSDEGIHPRATILTGERLIDPPAEFTSCITYLCINSGANDGHGIWVAV